jgi:hypothetical protein
MAKKKCWEKPKLEIQVAATASETREVKPPKKRRDS